mmetsp:Transcript_35232/g.76960  ORF Transcript_35232/g.76960 Transcript_35232/m.76960 type:complete len:1007 (+) Transcript_35232:78-3098(+)
MALKQQREAAGPLRKEGSMRCDATRMPLALAALAEIAARDLAEEPMPGSGEPWEHLVGGLGASRHRALQKSDSEPGLLKVAAVELDNKRLREEIRAMCDTIKQQSSQLSHLWSETNQLQMDSGSDNPGLRSASLMSGVAELSRLRLTSNTSGVAGPCGGQASTGGGSRGGLVGALGRFPSESRLPLFTPTLDPPPKLRSPLTEWSRLPTTAGQAMETTRAAGFSSLGASASRYEVPYKVSSLDAPMQRDFSLDGRGVALSAEVLRCGSPLESLHPAPAPSQLPVPQALHPASMEGFAVEGLEPRTEPGTQPSGLPSPAPAGAKAKSLQSVSIGTRPVVDMDDAPLCAAPAAHAAPAALPVPKKLVKQEPSSVATCGDAAKSARDGAADASTATRLPVKASPWRSARAKPSQRGGLSGEGSSRPMQTVVEDAPRYTSVKDPVILWDGMKEPFAEAASGLIIPYTRGPQESSNEGLTPAAASSVCDADTRDVRAPVRGIVTQPSLLGRSAADASRLSLHQRASADAGRRPSTSRVDGSLHGVRHPALTAREAAAASASARLDLALVPNLRGRPDSDDDLSFGDSASCGGFGSRISRGNLGATSRSGLGPQRQAIETDGPTGPGGDASSWPKSGAARRAPTAATAPAAEMHGRPGGGSGAAKRITTEETGKLPQGNGKATARHETPGRPQLAPFATDPARRSQKLGGPSTERGEPAKRLAKAAAGGRPDGPAQGEKSVSSKAPEAARAVPTRALPAGSPSRALPAGSPSRGAEVGAAVAISSASPVLTSADSLAAEPAAASEKGPEEAPVTAVKSNDLVLGLSDRDDSVDSVSESATSDSEESAGFPTASGQASTVAKQTQLAASSPVVTRAADDDGDEESEESQDSDEASLSGSAAASLPVNDAGLSQSRPSAGPPQTASTTSTPSGEKVSPVAAGASRDPRMSNGAASKWTQPAKDTASSGDSHGVGDIVGEISDSESSCSVSSFSPPALTSGAASDTLKPSDQSRV